MDSNQHFQIEVIQKYGINKILKPKNLGAGSLDNVILSDLRKELDFCYYSISLKRELIDYLQDYLVDLRVGSISNQKKRIKNIKHKKNNLKNKHPNLDENNENDWDILDKINNYSWALQQEKYIFHYLKEQKIFIREWINQKIVEYGNQDFKKENNLIELQIEKKHKFIPKILPFYCVIGALFAQNYIYRVSKKIEFSYFYNDVEFPNPSQLSKYIKNEVLITERSVHQYIDDTLKNNKTTHNLYSSKTQKDNIIQYCLNENIKISNEKFK
jgi:hypothetical protein